jgi:adenine-specific DNA-methyltransferase
MNKTDLIQKIKQLDNLSQDERAYLINLVNTKKKYGLVWEDKPEDVEEQLRTQLPVLREVAERRITASSSPLREEGNPGTKSTQNLQTSLFETESVEQDISSSLPLEEGRDVGASPNHILIEGDNLHALTALTFTHEGKIDVIYIDPPYNTGNKDFKYNDSFVDREDSYRHSKWLSFMDKRLRIAKRLLSDKGVIFISIDDNEQAQLKLLCDEVLGEENFVDNIIWEKNYAPRNDAKYFSAAHDFIVVYKKGDWERKLDERSEKSNAMYRYDDNDGRGLYRTGDVLVKTFNQSSVFPVTNPNTNKEYLPPQGSCWRYSKETFCRMIDENRIYWGKDGKGAPQAKRYLNEVKQGTVPQTIWKYTDVGHTQDGKNELKDLELTNRAFETPKPSRLLKKIISYDLRKGAIVLDFFAGSGTTLHATMALNAEDGGNRQCILVTNNENNICEEVTYERNRKVIQGYTNSKGIAVPGLTSNNLRYYQCDFVGRQPSLKNKRKLTCLATELLCIKENCYEERKLDFIKSQDIRYFEENEKRMLIVYEDHAIGFAVEVIKSIISESHIPENGIRVYVFSPGQYPFTEEFEEVLPYLTLCALPDAIYKAYMNILPKRNKQIKPLLDEDQEESKQNTVL